MNRQIKSFVVIGMACSALASGVFALKQPKPLQQNCPADRIQIAAVGDILLHTPLQRKASHSGFESLWSEVKSLIEVADFAVANVEGPMAYGVNKSGQLVKDPGHRVDGDVYTSYPLFNYHPKLAAALKNSGFDVVSTANNHALDRQSVGIDRTIKILKNANLGYTGTKSRENAESWYSITENKNFKIAWIGCTNHTNGIQDKHQQVLHCFKSKDRRNIRDTVKSLRKQVDAVVILPHWGVQYSHTVSKQQRRFAIEMLEAGATAVIGNHPHVVQPVRSYKTKDGRDTLVAYSLGNFVSYQGTPKNRSTIILFLQMEKSPKGARITNFAYVPAYMQNRSGMKDLRLTLLKAKDKKSVAFRILSKQLDVKKMMLDEDSIRDYLCVKKLKRAQDVQIKQSEA